MELKIRKYVYSWLVLATCLLVGCVLKSEHSAITEKPSLKAPFVYPSAAPKIAKLLNAYREQGSLSKFNNNTEHYARNIISWQMEHGGFGLHDASFYQKPWDGKLKRSVWVSKGRELGNFDDDATISEIRFLAEVYAKTIDANLKSLIKVSINDCLEFIFKSQYENGG